MYSRFATALVMIVGLALVPSAPAQFSFTDLSQLGGHDLVGLSPDGGTIFGSSGQPGFGWPLYYRDGQVTFLPFPGYGNGIARAGAPDGTIVGQVRIGMNETSGDAAIWQNGALSLLERAPGGSTADAQAISSDGHVIVGSARVASFKNQPARWVDGRIEPLGDIPGSDSNGVALAVNADGSVIVGSAAANTRAFRWMNGAMEALPLIGEDIQQSLAFDVSADGRRIVGVQNDFTFLSDALLWEDGVPRNLGYLPGANKGWANAISADGSLVFGNSGTGFNFRAFIWDELSGMQDLLQALQNAGADLQGWTQLEYIRDVSADGHTLLGYGYNAQGEYSPFLATIPEPGTLALAAVSLVMLVGRGRRSGG